MDRNEFLNGLEMPVLEANLALIDKIMFDAAGRGLSGFLKNRLIAGKRLRPILLILAAGGKADPRILKAAAAVELIHQASKLHDDALDEDVPSPAGYILGGDQLLNAGLSLAAKQGIAVIGILSEAVAKMIEGEYRQAALVGASGPEDKKYQAVCILKTASLFSAAAAMGGQLGGKSAKSIKALEEFGRRFGLAYQINDDIADGHFAMKQSPPAFAEARSQLRHAKSVLNDIPLQAEALEKYASKALPDLS